MTTTIFRPKNIAFLLITYGGANQPSRRNELYPTRTNSNNQFPMGLLEKGRAPSFFLEFVWRSMLAFRVSHDKSSGPAKGAFITI
jgi:hypothetical protein